MSSLSALREHGQSPWLNYLRRALMDSGELLRMLDEGVRGVTLTPSIVEKAVTCSSDYDALIQRLEKSEEQARPIHEALLIDDVQRAADILYPVYDESDHRDGFVTLALNPELAHNAVSMVAEGRRLGGICAAVNRSNVMIEIPATPAGIEALRELISDGCNVHVTQIFSVSRYELVAEAYLQGLTEFLETHSVWRLTPASVASLPVGTVDWEVDEALDRLGRPELRGKAGIALAKLLYARYREIFSGERWRRLANKGAAMQRLLWINTVPRRLDYPDTYYAEALIGPETVHALSPATLHAFRDHGRVASTLSEGLAEARLHMEALRALGIEEASAQKPQEKRLQAEARTFQLLAKSVIRKHEEMEGDWQRLELLPGRYAEAVERGLEQLCAERVMCRIWEHDASIWNGSGTGQFDWLHVLEPMEANAGRMQRMVQRARAAGYRKALVVAAGGGARVAELFAQTFGRLPHIPGVLSYTPGPHLEITVLDVSEGRLAREALEGLAADETLIVLSDQPAGREMLPIFEELYDWVASAVGEGAAGAHFVVISSKGSKLAQVAEAHGVHERLLDRPGSRASFNALSYSGLFAAALTGTSLDELLDRAARMACNASGCNSPVRGDNVAAQLGTVLGVVGGQRQLQPTFITSPFLNSFGDWASALLSTHLGSGGKGLQPASQEGLAAADDERLLIVLQMEGDRTHEEAVRALRTTGYPMVILHVKEPYELGGLLFMWQMAVVVAGYHMGRNPFQRSEEDRRVLAMVDK